MSFMHFVSQKSACLHFEHLVLAAFPHHSHIPDLDVRVLTADLTSPMTPDILSTFDTERLPAAKAPKYEGSHRTQAVEGMGVCG